MVSDSAGSGPEAAPSDPNSGGGSGRGGGESPAEPRPQESAPGQAGLPAQLPAIELDHEDSAALAPDVEGSDVQVASQRTRADGPVPGEEEAEASGPLRAVRLEALCGQLADVGPTPGAGSGAAASAALGAALVSMAFRRSASEGASPVPAYMGGRADALDALRETLLDLVDEDAEAYAAFLSARAASRDGDAAQAKRRAALERAARSAVEVPFDILESALAGLRLAAVGAPDQHPNLHCETEAGALALHAAVLGAARIVRENVPIAAVESTAFAEDHARVLPELLAEAARLVEEVRRATAVDDGCGDEPAGAPPSGSPGTDPAPPDAGDTSS